MSSVAPVSRVTNSVFVQFLPPSVVMNTPRSSFGPYKCPMAATHTMFGSLGWTMTREMACVSFRPMFSNVTSAALAAIAFVLFQTPLPYELDWRLLDSPDPTYRMFGSLGASARSPIEP